MNMYRSRFARPETISLSTQDERDRLAMVMMQLDMALALAREKGLIEVQTYLEAALAEARTVRWGMFN